MLPGLAALVQQDALAAGQARLLGGVMDCFVGLSAAVMASTPVSPSRIQQQHTQAFSSCGTSGTEGNSHSSWVNTTISSSSSSSSTGSSTGSSNSRQRGLVHSRAVPLCCWTSGQALHGNEPWRQQQLRGFAAKGKGGKAAAAPAQPASKPAPSVNPYAPPKWRVRAVPRGIKGDAVARATPAQRALLSRLNPSGGPLRSLRQLGWPLGQKQVLALAHDQLAGVAGTNVAVLPFVLDSMYQSAASLAQVVRDYLADGRGMPQVEQFLLTTIAALPAADIPFEGIKVAIKGRMSGKGGMTSRKVWTWGRTSTSTLSDPVDYAHEAVITRAGYIGIKVWIRYKRSHMEDQQQCSTRAAMTVTQLLALPAPTSLPSRSSSAWWNTPAPLQPSQHKAWQAFAPSYDPLTATRRITAAQQPSPAPAGSSVDG